MKLEVGMYCRTDEKGIGKTTFGDGGKYDLNVDATFYNCHNIKASFNLIDLIEEEDLIKYKDNIIYHIGASYSTENKEKGFRKCIFTFEGERLFLDEMKVEEDIKSIVTKESFKSVEYEVKE